MFECFSRALFAFTLRFFAQDIRDRGINFAFVALMRDCRCRRDFRIILCNCIQFVIKSAFKFIVYRIGFRNRIGLWGLVPPLALSARNALLGFVQHLFVVLCRDGFETMFPDSWNVHISPLGRNDIRRHFVLGRTIRADQSHLIPKSSSSLACLSIIL